MTNTKQVCHNRTGKKRGRPPGKSRKTIMKEQMKQRKTISKIEKWLDVYLLAEEDQIDALSASLGSMLTATRDIMIQNNNVIPIDALRTLKKHNETLSKEITVLQHAILQKIKIGGKILSGKM